MIVKTKIESKQIYLGVVDCGASCKVLLGVCVCAKNTGAMTHSFFAAGTIGLV